MIATEPLALSYVAHHEAVRKEGTPCATDIAVGNSVPMSGSAMTFRRLAKPGHSWQPDWQI